MAPGYFPPLPEPRPANVMGSALAGYGAVQDMQTAQSRNALAQMQLEKEQRSQSALAEYGKSRDVEAAMNIDPATGMALKKHIYEINDKERQTLKDKIEIFDKHKANAIGNPEVYKQMLTELGPKASQMFVAPEKYAAMSPAQQQAVLFKGEQIAATLKKEMDAYQMHKLYGVDIPKAQAYIGNLGERTAQGRERVAQGWDRNALLRRKSETDAQYKDRMARVAEGKGKPEDYETVKTTSGDIMHPTTTTIKRRVGGGGAQDKTLIGKTPDGKMVYQDSQGNKFVAE